MTLESAMNEQIHHPICRECETVAYCAAHGCIPVEEYDELHSAGVLRWLHVGLAIFWAAVAAICIVWAIHKSELFPMVAWSFPQVFAGH